MDNLMEIMHTKNNWWFKCCLSTEKYVMQYWKNIGTLGTFTGGTTIISTKLWVSLSCKQIPQPFFTSPHYMYFFFRIPPFRFMFLLLIPSPNVFLYFSSHPLSFTLHFYLIHSFPLHLSQPHPPIFSHKLGNGRWMSSKLLALPVQTQFTWQLSRLPAQPTGQSGTGREQKLFLRHWTQ